MGCNGKNWGIPRENSPGIEMMRTEYGLFEEFSGSYRVHNLGVLLVHGPGRVLEQIVSLGNFKLIMMNILAKLIGPQRCSPQNPQFF